MQVPNHLLQGRKYLRRLLAQTQKHHLRLAQRFHLLRLVQTYHRSRRIQGCRHSLLTRMWLHHLPAQVRKYLHSLLKMLLDPDRRHHFQFHWCRHHLYQQ